jgi:phosphopantothenoylcysteine synthetase/decarboxylase
MKRFLLAICISIICAGAAKADKYTIKREALPESAREMLDEHFPKAKVSMIKVDRHLLKKTDYDVKLTNGTKIEFSNAGKWTSVDCGKKEVPSAIVPRAIRNYVSKNYADATIVKIKKKTTAYELTLSGGHLLTFSLLGTFKSEVLPD